MEPGQTYAMVGLSNGGGRIDALRREMELDWPTFLETAEAEEVIESLAVEGQERIDALITTTRTADVRHVATGGGSRNARLIERKREIGDRPIEVSEVNEATALGAAMLARRASAE